MKVLVPTDFSPTADFAFAAALLLAEKRQIELHLFHVPEIPAGWEYLPPADRFYDIVNKDIAIAARDQLKQLKAKAIAAGLVCEIHYAGGNFFNALGEIVTRLKTDLVIMGSHGASGKTEWFIGSNTQKALRKLDCNLLVVKAPLENMDFSRVLFATNLNVEDKDAFMHFLDFIKVFPVQEIHLLTIRTGSFFGAPQIVIDAAQEDFAEMAGEYEICIHEAQDFSVEHGIRKFAQANKIQLIAMSNLGNRPIKHFLRGSNVEMIINHADVPVLSIDFVESAVAEKYTY